MLVQHLNKTHSNFKRQSSLFVGVVSSVTVCLLISPFPTLQEHVLLPLMVISLF